MALPIFVDLPVGKSPIRRRRAHVWHAPALRERTSGSPRANSGQGAGLRLARCGGNDGTLQQTKQIVNATVNLFSHSHSHSLHQSQKAVKK